MRRKRTLVVATVVLLAAPTAAVAWSSRSDGDDGSEPPTTELATVETAEVTRGDLTTDADHTAQVGYGDAWALPLRPGGVVTASPSIGTVVDFGDELVRVDNLPIVLVEGGFPMYRELALASTRQVGFDVLQLQHFLLANGFDADGELTADGEFGLPTRDAVRDWQASVGRSETGRVDGTQLLFSPTPLRLASSPRIGAAFDGLQVTDVDPVVTIETDSEDLVDLPVDGEVTIELAAGTMHTGTVTGRERVVGADGATSWVSTVAVTAALVADLDVDETSVLVHTTTIEADDVLIVPVSALLAVAEGGFAVEVVTPGGTRLVAVDVGTVIDARAEIIGDVDAGQHVVVPT
jgi:peptidoglycan hydrolase-like protein with peptidoglycan-binding domain